MRAGARPKKVAADRQVREVKEGMPIRVAYRFLLSQLPQRAQADLPRHLRSVLACCVALLALSECQYVSGVANLEIGKGKAAPAATTDPANAGQAGSSDATDGSAGGSIGGSTGGSTGGEPGKPDAGSVMGGPWDCVGATLQDPGSADYLTSGTISKLNTSTPVLDVTVSACLSSDANCSAPLASAVASDGAFSLIVPRAFQGYLRVEPPAPFVPAIVQMTMPISTMRGHPDIVLFDTGTLNSLAGIMGVTIDDSAGHAFFAVGDCNGEPARNISVSVSSTDPGRYAQYYLADNSIPTTDRKYTGQQGGGGFVNLAPGLATFQIVKIDTDIRLATVVAPIKAGVTTFFKVQPH